MHALRFIVGAVVGIFLLWVLVVLVVSIRSYFLMFRPHGDSAEISRAYSLEQGEFDEAFLSLGWETARVRSPRGYELAAIALRTDAVKAAGTAIFVHGFTSTHYSMMKYMQRFSERSWNLVAYDLAGHGDSVVPRALSKSPSFGFYEKSDLAAVVEWAAARFPEAGPVVLVGESMGAATVLQYAPLGDPIGMGAEKRPVDAIIADCPFSSAGEELAWRLAEEGIPRFVADGAVSLVSTYLLLLRGFRAEDASPAKAIMESPVPILFVHGGDDRYVPTEMSVRMADERKRRGVGPTELLIVPGARHAKSVLVDPATWFQTVFTFIDKYAGHSMN
jgi:alpha-beta hydrolase superfamily lysophospholipase